MTIKGTLKGPLKVGTDDHDGTTRDGKHKYLGFSLTVFFDPGKDAKSIMDKSFHEVAKRLGFRLSSKATYVDLIKHLMMEAGMESKAMRVDTHGSSSKSFGATTYGMIPIKEVKGFRNRLNTHLTRFLQRLNAHIGSQKKNKETAGADPMTSTTIKSFVEAARKAEGIEVARSKNHPSIKVKVIRVQDRNPMHTTKAKGFKIMAKLDVVIVDELLANVLKRAPEEYRKAFNSRMGSNVTSKETVLDLLKRVLIAEDCGIKGVFHVDDFQAEGKGRTRFELSTFVKSRGDFQRRLNLTLDEWAMGIFEYRELGNG